MTQIGIPFERKPAPPRPGALTVSALVHDTDQTLLGRFGRFWVEGEIRGLSTPSSGHLYFKLADDRATIAITFFRSDAQRLRFRLVEGAKVQIYGRLGVYARDGKLQIYGENAEPIGRGELLARRLELQAKLAAEGLFAQERKRPLPSWPRVIGVVTSRTGAAFLDIVKVVQARCPARILLAPATVQGVEAPHELVRALRRLQEIPDVDVIIVARGGGSSDDLSAFDTEVVVRAVAACRVPVISAVGHETDVTLCDHVADVRAATPSHAGQLAVSDYREALQRLRSLERRLESGIKRAILDRRSRLHHATLHAQRAAIAPMHGFRRRLAQLQNRVDAADPRRRIAGDRRRLERCRSALLARSQVLSSVWRNRVNHAGAKLEALSPLAVLQRGYALVADASGKLISDAAEVRVGDNLEVQLARGHLRVNVSGSEPT